MPEYAGMDIKVIWLDRENMEGTGNTINCSRNDAKKWGFVVKNTTARI